MKSALRIYNMKAYMKFLFQTYKETALYNLIKFNSFQKCRCSALLDSQPVISSLTTHIYTQDNVYTYTTM